MYPTIMTYTGKYFDLIEPRTHMVCIEDIAHALSNICRYTGHCREFYSVAQHSVLVSLNIHPDAAFEGLMHDAAEAYLGDVSSPLKQLLPEYKRMESRVEKVIQMAFGYSMAFVPDRLVKNADLCAMATEKRDLMPPRPGAKDEWALLRGHPPFEQKIVPWSPERAERIFFSRFYQLRGND